MVKFGKIVYADNLMARAPLNSLLYLYECFFINVIHFSLKFYVSEQFHLDIIDSYMSNSVEKT